MRSSILITTDQRGYIPSLRTEGPIVRPMSIPTEVVRDMLLRGYIINEHNENDPSKRVELTLANFDDSHKFAYKPTPQTEPAGTTPVTVEVVEPEGDEHLGFSEPSAEVVPQPETPTPMAVEAVKDAVVIPAEKAAAAAEQSKSVQEAPLTKAQKKALAKAEASQKASAVNK